MQRIIGYWLGRSPRRERRGPSVPYVIFDGTFLDHRCGMYAAMDGVKHTILQGAYGVKEGPPDLRNFCLHFGQNGFEPRAATIDGNPHVFQILSSLWPRMPIQRCLVHIQRQGLAWCRRHPKRTDARQLRRIFLMVPHINTQAQREHFQRIVARWETRYGPSLLATPNRGWVITDVQRARSMLLKALPFMFHYLKDPSIPRSTNALEGYFARLKQRYRQHRGLSIHKRASYFRWYFTLCPK